MDESVRGTVSSERSEEDELVRALSHGTENTETWLSGRKYLTANEAGANPPRGFESLRLRSLRVVIRSRGLRNLNRRAASRVVVVHQSD